MKKDICYLGEKGEGHIVYYTTRQTCLCDTCCQFYNKGKIHCFSSFRAKCKYLTRIIAKPNKFEQIQNN